MTGDGDVATLQARGVELVPAGDRLRFRPGDGVTPEEREALRRHKAEVLRLLAQEPAPDPAAVARVLGLPLDQLDRVLEVRVPWWPVSLWFCPGEADAEGLLAEGVSRGRIWTAGELIDVLTIPNITKASARTLAVAKLEFDGEVATVRLTPSAPPAGAAPGQLSLDGTPGG